ncbi:hypothetical protein [Streptomyces buecherae]|uniref:hypothetical protein n=1 Tax=Streptomyces buecherae TaxID=2763006 RepID=UPI001C2731B7|nr:hypothetical protein [Streptomyces buecherae]
MRRVRKWVSSVALIAAIAVGGVALSASAVERAAGDPNWSSQADEGAVQPAPETELQDPNWG